MSGVRRLSAVVSRIAWIGGTPFRLVLIGLIRLYRVSLGGVLGGQCRFHPTCSRYAEDAVRVHGAVRGTALSAWRVVRCSPLSRGGSDPVPARARPARMGHRGRLAYEALILRDGGR